MTDEPDNSAFPTRNSKYYYHGLTKREYFAGLAMQGMISNQVMSAGITSKAESTGRVYENVLAKVSIQCADTLIKELSEKN